MSQPIQLAFLWHMHQPLYRVGGEHVCTMPWVRMRQATFTPAGISPLPGRYRPSGSRVGMALPGTRWGAGLEAQTIIPISPVCWSTVRATCMWPGSSHRPGISLRLTWPNGVLRWKMAAAHSTLQPDPAVRRPPRFLTDQPPRCKLPPRRYRRAQPQPRFWMRRFRPRQPNFSPARPRSKPLRQG